MNAQEAVDQPRIHHQWMPDTLNVEKSMSPDTIEALKARGHTVAFTGLVGELGIIRIVDGWLEGAADGRVEATAKGY